MTYPANVPELEAGFPAELHDVMLHVQILIQKCPNVSDNIRLHNTRDAHLEVQDREFWVHVRGTHQQSLHLWVVELESVLIIHVRMSATRALILRTAESMSDLDAGQNAM